jgi:predicted enzyme related to lactoylglutathione lyase
MDTRGIDATFLLVKEMPRARAFYDALLEREPDTASEHWCEYTLPDGATLALGYHPGMEWRPGVGVLLGVTSLDTATRRAAAAGGTMTGVEMGGRICKSAECLDTEGNSLYLHERYS